MINNIKLLTALVLLLVLPMLLTAQTIEAGKWRIEWQNDKSVNYVHNGKVILKNTCIQASTGGDMLRSTDYTTINLSDEPIEDVFGNGTKYTITYTADGIATELEQVFFFYPEKEYLLTEAYLVSTNNISSNYIAPLFTETRSTILETDNSNRVLSVPFDNDAWVGYSSFPLTTDSVSFEVTSIYSGMHRNGLVIGSVEHDVWKTGIRYSTKQHGYLDKLECYGGITHVLTRDINFDGKPSKEHGHITGKRVKSPKILIGLFDDWRTGMEQYGEANALVTPPRPWNGGNIFGWNSWGGMAEKVNYEGAVSVSDFIKTDLQSDNFLNDDNTAYVILDSYWDNFTDAQLGLFVKNCEANGQVPGIYWSPFSDWADWDNSGDRMMEGSMYAYKDAYLYANGEVRKIASKALDPTHPGTFARMYVMIEKFKRLGFKYIKLDFLNNGTLEADSYYNKNVTTGIQAYNIGMAYLAELCGEDMFLALSIAPVFPSQYGNSRRISCDAWGAAEDSEYVLNGLSFGWWLDRVYNYNDADNLVLMNNSYTEGENSMRITSGVITGVYILGDNFSDKGSFIGNAEARARAKKFATNPAINDIARIGKSFHPVEGYKADGKNSWGRNRSESIFAHHTEEYLYLAVFNFSDTPQAHTIPIGNLGIQPEDIGTIKELWQNVEANILQNGNISCEVPARDVQVYRIEKGNATGISTIQADKLSCYISGSKLFVHAPENLSALAVYSTDGTLIRQQVSAKEQQPPYVLDLSGMPQGVFFLHAESSSGKSMNTKFALTNN